MQKVIIGYVTSQQLNPHRVAKMVRGKVSQAAVYDYLTGKRDMRSEFVWHLLAALGLEIRPKE